MENITASDFSDFKVSDDPLPLCHSCGPANRGPAPPAPVIIKGRNYCVWCALNIARELLTK
jgi:hypothetical protein